MSKPEIVAWITEDKLHLIFEGVLDPSQLVGCSPLMTVSDHEAAMAELQENLQAAQDRYFREVYGLNNEGDPIGGDPAGGYANENDRLHKHVSALEAERNELLGLLREARDSDAMHRNHPIWTRIDATLERHKC